MNSKLTLKNYPQQLLKISPLTLNLKLCTLNSKLNKLTTTESKALLVDKFIGLVSALLNLKF